MPSAHGHKHSSSVTQNRKAQLANAYNELGKELSSNKIRVIGNYTLGKVIGEGSYGKVRLGTHRLTSTRVAIKQIPKDMSSSLTREIHHHRKLHHPHITQMYEVIATESHIWIVTELCCGGELFDYLVEKTRLTEDEARGIFGQLCLAVAHLHNNGIVHRDLKLENVLLDERCRVKLGDFGFTREFEKGSFMETFCGTTGYAAPEMLQGKKYQGPEVDVWSLGVILYCLLTGALPFDDDDEDVMKSMIIKGDFEDPDWLSLESRDLIKNILVQDPNARLAIPQILEHTWFTKRDLTYEHCESPITTPGSLPFPSTHLETIPSEAGSSSERPSLELPSTEGSSSLNTSTSSSDVDTSSPTTPADDDPFLDYKPSSASPTQMSPRATGLHRNPSESTIRKGNGPSEFDSLYSKITTGHQHPETVQEEGEVPSPPRLASASSGSTTSKTAPPAHAVRTPARTKRRSVSSALSIELGNEEDGSQGIKEKSLPPLPNANGRDSPANFSSLLSTPTPIIFSTPLERQLLNSLSILGFDTAQIVHSVLNDACDAAGAVWWMVKKKAETNGGLGTGLDTPTTATYPIPPSVLGQPNEKARRESGEKSPSKRRKHLNTGTQTEAQYFTLNAARSAPQLAFVPPTPTIPSHSGRTTPPRPVTPTRSSATLLSPSDASSKSHPSTPSSSVREKSEKESGLHGSLRDKDWMKKGDGRKNRSGSVSIMQRVTTGLEAAGLVRKKSSEAVREKEEKKEREKSREAERKMSGGTTSYGEDSRTSHSSHSSSKLTKSPPLKPTIATGKDYPPLPSTPPPSEKQQQHYLNHVQAHVGNSPWVLAEVGATRKLDPRNVTARSLSASDSTSVAAATAGHNHNIPPTPSNTPGEWPTSPITLGEGETGAYRPPQRNRQSLLSAIKFWLHTEDKKGKRKDSGSSGKSPVQAGPSVAYQPGNQTGYNGGTVKRRGSSGGGRFNVRSGHRQRPSNSSRRSSSVASRRSSGASMQIPSAAIMDSPQIPTRRSFGSHTPNSDRGEYPSRPSSVISFSMQTRHRQSPSQSSVSSMRLRTASPMGKYHRRLGSGSSSTTRVVRHHAHRERHVRSDSTTSSLYSPTSSRPPSFYELSENEGGLSKTSPNKRRKSIEETPRKGSATTSMTATFVAQKRTAPFASPAVHGSIGRSSWKKSWGMEPPGWQSRTTHLPVEILAVSSSNEPLSLRDVFTGRPSLSMGDESDWVDEDDDIPAFIGGLGQMGASSSNNNSNNEPTITLSPAPRGHRSTGSRGSNRASGSGSVVSGSSRQKSAGHSPIERLSPIPMETTQETRGGRRQLPNTRAGPAFKQAIQEEDEDEEE